MINLKIITHSGGEYQVIVENYDAVQINTDLNSNEINTVCFGNIILSRIDIKAVIPL